VSPRSASPRRFFSEEEARRIVAAIGAAEASSRGEIRVHVEERCRGRDPVARATRVFEALGMTRTELRAGVLIYLATRDRLFAALGDSGIDAKVGPAFWSELVAELGRRFAEERFADGVVEAVARAGHALAAHFPRDAARADVDELPDAISFADPTE
jgi:uncharacterized membrane protein